MTAEGCGSPSCRTCSDKSDRFARLKRVLLRTASYSALSAAVWLVTLGDHDWFVVLAMGLGYALHGLLQFRAGMWEAADAAEQLQLEKSKKLTGKLMALGDRSMPLEQLVTELMRIAVEGAGGDPRDVAMMRRPDEPRPVSEYN